MFVSGHSRSFPKRLNISLIDLVLYFLAKVRAQLSFSIHIAFHSFALSPAKEKKFNNPCILELKNDTIS